jgi:MtN3 and saliva related transmembrane protein
VCTIRYTALFVFDYFYSIMTPVYLIGYAAAALTTCAYIPQAWKTIITRDTSALSAGTFTMLVAGTLCWLAYGIMLADMALILANAITAVLSGIILLMKLRNMRR